MYLLNGNLDLAEKWYKIVEDEMSELNKDSGKLMRQLLRHLVTLFIVANRDKYFVAMFYKGVLLKHMKKYAEAVECFKTIINEYVTF